jgi:hypothetical protein
MSYHVRPSISERVGNRSPCEDFSADGVAVFPMRALTIRVYAAISYEEREPYDLYAGTGFAAVS